MKSKLPLKYMDRTSLRRAWDCQRLNDVGFAAKAEKNRLFRQPVFLLRGFEFAQAAPRRKLWQLE